MVDFAEHEGVLLAEGHGHAEPALRAGVKTALTSARAAEVADLHATSARIDETWFSDEHGFGHDCSQHQDVPKSLWSPGCLTGGFRPVTIAADVPAPPAVQRAIKHAAPADGGINKGG